MVAVLFASEDIGDMYFDGGCRNGENGVVDGHGGVAVAASVDDNAVMLETRLLNAVDDFALYVALEMDNLHVGEFVLELVDEFFHRGGAVEFGFADTSEVEVRAVDYCDFFHGIESKNESRP